MTRAQEVIKKYIYTNFHEDSVLLFPVDQDKIKLIDAEGESLMLTLNLYGDIMDADTRQIYAISDLPHNLDQIGLQLPQNWKEVDRG